jgi:uncharacterized protein
MRLRILILLLTTFFLTLPSLAQEEVNPEATEEPLPVVAQIVEARGDDRLRLYGDFYLVNPERPTVILLHEMYTNRASWNPLLRPLLENGYNVLAVDIRGWGSTRGAINWSRAIDDVGIWMTWLREEAGVRPDAIHTMGSSMGSTLAIRACANDEFCRSAIAISPGLSYYGYSVKDAIIMKAVLAIYAERDRFPALGVPEMLEIAPDTLSVQTYAGNKHGMLLVEEELEPITTLILEWLAAHNE